MTTKIKKPTPLPLRNDTILGVCEAVGQDFGFNPLWLRLAFIAPLFWQPVYTFAAYLLLGAVVAASRYFFPRPVQNILVEHPADVDHANQEERLSIAA
ncbi:MAG: PspC domain-containing protein [Sphingomicrobium sp.]